MDGFATNGPLRFFRDLPDPRARNVRHRLIDILVLSLCAVLCDADSWEDFEVFVRVKRPWFQTFLDFKHGVPSADTFRRVFSRLDPAGLERCFLNWMKSVVELSGGQLLAIDGKSIRRSFEHAWDKSGMAHMVSLFVHANGQVFTQVKTDGKGREIEGILHLLGLADLQGAVVTIDALGCQKSITQTIIDGGGDYVIGVKSNQPTLHDSLQRHLDEMILEKFKGVNHDFVETVDAGHGRIETRRVWVTDEIDWLKQRDQWTGLKQVAVVEAVREVIGGPRSVERHYYIGSRSGLDASFMAGAIRGHWSIENGLHHVLDVSFHEDDSRIHKSHAAENVSRLRRMALNLLKDKGAKFAKRVSIRGRRKMAGWDHDFLLKLVTG